MDRHGRYFTLLEVLYLIPHKRNERSYNQGNPPHHKTRDLERDALAAPRWEQTQGIAPGKDRIDDLTLLGSELRVAPIVLQDLFGSFEARFSSSLLFFVRLL